LTTSLALGAVSFLAASAVPDVLPVLPALAFPDLFRLAAA